MQPTHRTLTRLPLLGVAAFLLPSPALAAAHGPAPGLIWGIPFVGMLLSIAVLPMVVPHFWHKRMGLVALLWSLALLVPMALLQGIGAAAFSAWHAALAEYFPFVTLLLALFTAAGGILVRGGPGGTPAGNTALLAIGAAFAGLMGTTGAAMVLIHPLLRANAHRTRKVHLVIFFILLVANTGGATTPLGDPPLYLGFLNGVPFAWPIKNLLGPLLIMVVPLLAAFFLWDRRLAAKEPPPPPAEPFELRGAINLLLLAVVVFAVLLQGVWDADELIIFGQEITLDGIVAMAIFIAVFAVSLAITPADIREGNLFTWHPMEEVAKLFAALFITITPVLAMLAAGFDGPLAPLLKLTLNAAGKPEPFAYFWLTGILSAFLDNAPTYLVFFQLAGGDPHELTTTLNPILQAISAGAVFFGALSYIGNAPNMMVRAIATHRGVVMPGFFPYIAIAGALLMPGFLVLTWLFFL